MERKDIEAAKKKLYDAAKSGDVAMLKEVLQEDPYLLDEVSFASSRNLLHIATLWGQADIVEELLKINPKLARNVDSQKSSPLHIVAAEEYLGIPQQDIESGLWICDDSRGMSPAEVAAAERNFGIARELVSAAPEMLWCRDGQGMNPVHVAAINGHVEILKEILQLDTGPAMERAHRGQTVLHLCVKHRRLEALKFLVKELGDLVPAKDDDGNTLLDYAVSYRQSQIVNYLESIKTENIKFERMVGEDIEKKLYDAATEGDVERFQQLVQDDRHLVERVSYPCSRNLLHIATQWGQLAIVEELLKTNPKLARAVDSQKSSPLHIAAGERHNEVEVAKRSFEMARELLSAAPEMLWCRDGQGMNPVHVAAMNGHVDMLKEMLRLDRGPAMERVHRGQTVLHLCVKHGRREALKFLVKELVDLVAAKDDDGETLLHWAARKAGDSILYFYIIRYLADLKKIDKQSTNSMGKTAKQIVEENLSISPSDFHISSPIKYILSHNYYDELLFGFLSSQSMLELISKKREQTMVVMTLIATMAFQAAVSPPGGVWQDNTPPHRAGEAVIASTHPQIYKQLVRANATAFVSSLITIFLLAVKQQMERGFLLLFSSYVVWTAIASIAISYGGSVLVTASPNTATQSLSRVIKVVVAVSLSIFGATLFSSRPVKWLWSKMKEVPCVERVLYFLQFALESLERRWHRFRRSVTG